MPRLLLLSWLTLIGCTTFPALDDAISDAARQAPYPTLQPLPSITASGSGTDDTFEARVAALQARAERLQQIDIAALQ